MNLIVGTTMTKRIALAAIALAIAAPRGLAQSPVRVIDLPTATSKTRERLPGVDATRTALPYTATL